MEKAFLKLSEDDLRQEFETLSLELINFLEESSKEEFEVNTCQTILKLVSKIFHTNYTVLP